MRFHHAALAMLAAAGMGVASAAPTAALEALPPRYRNRWKAERRKKRPNMNHVSKRTRRKHRRARRAA